MVFDKGFKEKLEGEQGQKIRFLWMERQTLLIKGDLHASSQVPRNVDAVSGDNDNGIGKLKVVGPVLFNSNKDSLQERQVLQCNSPLSR